MAHSQSAAVDYVVLSNIVVDDIVLADGSERLGVLGGAATWAAAGIRCWSPSVGIISGMGADLAQSGRAWFESNDIDLEGVTTRAAHSPRTWVRYTPDGERAETPQHGEEHFRLMESSAAQIPESYQGARGLYIFRSHNPAFWASLRALPESPAQATLWEIAANAALPEFLPQVKQALTQVQLFSINRTEAFRLFGVSGPLDALHAALEAGARVVALRLGAEGSLITDGSVLLEVPAAPARVVDVTGGGNAYSGGFLAGYCGAAAGDWPDPLESAARCAASAAALVLENYGPPVRFDEETLGNVRAKAASITIARSEIH